MNKWVTLSGCAVAAFGVAACSLLDPLPRDADPFVPPAVYARWWAMTEACSEQSRNMKAIRWYRVPRRQFYVNGTPVAGYFNLYAKRIVLAEESDELGGAVRHEMLHALLKTGGHERSQFLEACAALVYCQGSCISDAGRWQLPRTAYVVLGPDSLDITSRAELLPRESDGQRWVALEVIVRNPRTLAVLVAAPGDAVTPPTFGFDLRGPAGGISGGEIAVDSSTLFFRPLETKRWLFEFRVAPDLASRRIPAGNYIVRGGYAREWAEYDSVAVSP